MICIRKFGNSFEAEIAKGLLEGAGIPAHVASDDVGGMHSHMQPVWGVRLYVPESTVEEAERVLSEATPLKDGELPEHDVDDGSIDRDPTRTPPADD